MSNAICVVTGRGLNDGLSDPNVSSASGAICLGTSRFYCKLSPANASYRHSQRCLVTSELANIVLKMINKYSNYYLFRYSLSSQLLYRFNHFFASQSPVIRRTRR